jgi:protein involved in polysaccharide export with SLBB domain
MLRKILLLILTCAAMAAAQDMLKAALEQRLGEGLSQKAVIPSLPAAPLEQTVNAEEYLVGPGDVVKIMVGDRSDLVYDVAVSPEGSLLLPAMGAIEVANLTLAAAKQRIIEKFSGRYLSQNVSVYLTQLRAFRVSVNGEVVNPGMVPVNALNRASEAIALAGGLRTVIRVRSEREQVRVETATYSETNLKSSQTKINQEMMRGAASQRNIVITRRDGSTCRVDLVDYLHTGNLKSNPFLLDGDVIFVPAEETRAGRVSIEGALRLPSEFEYAPGDCVAALIALAQGYTTDADSSFIELVRFIGPSSRTTRTRLSLDRADPAVRETSLNFVLQPDDRLYVRSLPKFHQGRSVEVVGEVFYPGRYDISEGQTHLKEIVTRAGGLTSNASLRSALVLRRAVEDVEDPEFERLKKMQVAEMTESEREYFKMKSRERNGAMGVNFNALFEKNDLSQNVILRDRDVINIPSQEITVKLTGQVVYPGLYPYEPGQTMKYYLEKAGGFNWNARRSRARIIKANTGEWAKADDDAIIDVGDTIFVPEKPERDWWTMYRELIMVLAQMATIYLVVDRAGKIN